ncbi:MAG: winged helix-turn-helix domain-containing protein, partial [Oscillospiraceae bacterium]|nr:winged helix-turn-helix domain-containing protein [Oscillospiraceae bacterium]
ELNIGRASLYRSFDSLEKLGLIEKNGRSVRIPDTEALRKFYLPEAEK